MNFREDKVELTSSLFDISDALADHFSSFLFNNEKKIISIFRTLRDIDVILRKLLETIYRINMARELTMSIYNGFLVINLIKL